MGHELQSINTRKVDTMSKHTTHKRSREARATTIARKQARAMKYGAL